ncbi:MotA/TolQ/ExbB proton channel family protein [Rheinheimera texasensis]|uniref:MotA/TolQ/ExbB proton channel family protein n=1 Tax=Rheinheimera texasensis TaxID=306205 RepID=UPI0032B25ABE
MAIASQQLYQTLVEGTFDALIVFSVITWLLIVIKAAQHLQISWQERKFRQDFWKARDLTVAATLKLQGPTARLAQVGFHSLQQAGKPQSDLEHSWDRQVLLERHLRQQIHKERRSLENGLAILASIGTTAPFVGLFGTVFGIIDALTAITAQKSASIEVVAGPIGEALVATGVGIAVAVPAVLAFNFFLRRLKLIQADLDDFATDFLNLLQKAGFRAPLIPEEQPQTNSATPAAGTTQEAYS